MKNTIFGHRRFVLFYLSRTSANIADSIYMIVLLYFIQSVTESVSYTSFTYSAITAASIFSFAIGPLVDRYSPMKLAGLSLLAQAVIILIVPFLIGERASAIIQILVLVFLASCFSLLFYPATNKLVPMLVRSKEEIVKMNALINSTDQLINIIGYLAGASIIIFFGMKNTFFLASGLLLLGGIMFWQMGRSLTTTVEKESANEKAGPYLLELKEGFSFVKRTPFLKIMMPFYALINFLLAMLIISIPALAVNEGSPIYYSLIYVAFFIGVLGGSTLTNYLPKSGLIIALAWMCMGVSLCLFAALNGIWLKMLAVVLLGVNTGIINVLQTAMIQIITPTNLLGRVMTFLSSISNASLPFGSLIGGMLTLQFSLEAILVCSAAIVLLSGFVFLFLRDIREYAIEDGQFGNQRWQGVDNLEKEL